jgi:hypothetical protein
LYRSLPRHDLAPSEREVLRIDDGAGLNVPVEPSAEPRVALETRGAEDDVHAVHHDAGLRIATASSYGAVTGVAATRACLRSGRPLAPTNA